MSKISLALSSWYKMQNYNFPWREKKTVYSIWISEIMLQQTQVNTASSYFKSWMKKFPSVDKVAFANIDTVLKLWEGLSQDLNFNVMFSQRGVLTISHSEHELKGMSRRVHAIRLNGIDSDILSPSEIKKLV